MRYLLAAISLVTILGAAPSRAAAQTHYQRYYQHRVLHFYTYDPAHYRYRALPPRWSVGLHLTGQSANHAVINEGLALGGMGGHVRVRGYRWGGELAVDVLGNSFAQGGISRVSVPIQASGMLYLLPYGQFNLYALGGLRVVPSHVRWDLPNLSAVQTFAELGAQAGVGAELLLSPFFALTADLRAFGTVRNDSDVSGTFYRELREDQPTPVPEKTAGLELSLGASFRF